MIRRRESEGCVVSGAYLRVRVIKTFRTVRFRFQQGTVRIEVVEVCKYAPFGRAAVTRV